MSDKTTEGPPLEPRETAEIAVYKCKVHGFTTDTMSIAVDPEKKSVRHFCPFCLGHMLNQAVGTMAAVGKLELPVPCTQDDVKAAVGKLAGTLLEDSAKVPVPAHKGTSETDAALRDAEPGGTFRGEKVGEIGEADEDAGGEG